MIVNVRGTSGSGKSTAVRAVMALATAAGYERHKHPLALACTCRSKCHGSGVCHSWAYCFVAPAGPPVTVLGAYEIATSGGCDNIHMQRHVHELVRHYSTYGHVLFEGLLISHLFSKYEALDRSLQPTPYIWACLDTPLDLCLERVQARRDASGKNRIVFNPQNTIAKWHDLVRVHEKCLAAGLDSRLIAHETAATEVWGWFK